MLRLPVYLFIVLGLSLVFNFNANAGASLCIYKSGNYIHFVKQNHKRSCDGYALIKKKNKKLYNRIKWHGDSKSSSNNYGEPWNINREENHFNKSVETIFWFISINHDDPQWEDFVEKTLGFTFKKQNFFRKNNSGELVSMNLDLYGNIILGEKVLMTADIFDKLIRAANDFREGKITRSEFNIIKNEIFETL